MGLIKREPVAVFGAVQIILLAAVTVLREFDVWDPTDDQVTALTALYVAVTALAVMFIRGRVTPTDQE
jgi:flagellar biosynthesis regulator FlbT